jgi:hypothetical protein
MNQDLPNIKHESYPYNLYNTGQNMQDSNNTKMITQGSNAGQ